MALTVSGALVGQQGMQSTSRPTFKYRIGVTLGAYTTGGYASLDATIKAALSALTGKTIISIRQDGHPAGGYILEWDRANDTLMVFLCGGAGAVRQELGNGVNPAQAGELAIEAV